MEGYSNGETLYGRNGISELTQLGKRSQEMMRTMYLNLQLQYVSMFTYWLNVTRNTSNESRMQQNCPKSGKEARIRAPSPHHPYVRVRKRRFNEDEQVPPKTSLGTQLPVLLTKRSSFQRRSQSSWRCTKVLCDPCRAGTLAVAGRSLPAGSGYACEQVANDSSNSSGGKKGVRSGSGLFSLCFRPSMRVRTRRFNF